ncbi:hypothetical protein ACWEQ4_00955 [Rhodococcus sp. NPDC003994]
MTSVDNAIRRNKIAAVTASYFAETCRTRQNHAGGPVGIDSRLVIGSFAAVIAALNGETDPEKLLVPPASVPALAIAALTSPATHEPPYYAKESDL